MQWLRDDGKENQALLFIIRTSAFWAMGKLLNVLLHVQPFWMQDQAWGSSLARE
ncbi:hypothetical protein L584_14540 [Pantoea agglomerans Tx10]|jgi:hypothetical protein|nr:hypothetical protein L584_14540 [Pantoea agglomerans Tx10]